MNKKDFYNSDIGFIYPYSKFVHLDSNEDPIFPKGFTLGVCFDKDVNRDEKDEVEIDWDNIKPLPSKRIGEPWDFYKLDD